jgi:hypothetical protein
MSIDFFGMRLLRERWCRRQLSLVKMPKMGTRARRGRVHPIFGERFGRIDDELAHEADSDFVMIKVNEPRSV